jgi:hypothetical protein
VEVEDPGDTRAVFHAAGARGSGAGVTDFPRLRRALEASRLWQSAAWLIERVQAAWERSRVAAAARAAAGAARALPLEARVRHVVLALGMAAAGYLALLAITPRYVAPAMPRAGIAGAAVLAFAVAACARAVIAAWRDSKIAEWLRSVRP